MRVDTRFQNILVEALFLENSSSFLSIDFISDRDWSAPATRRNRVARRVEIPAGQQSPATISAR
jgi:hypothetical protein